MKIRQNWNIYIVIFIFINVLSLASSQNLSTIRILSPSDIKIFKLDPTKSGFDLFVRKKDGINSIMLTDSTVDPQGFYDNFALRAYDADPTYTNETRTLNNHQIAPSDGSYFLITSTAQIFKPLGDDEWFHIFVPSSVVFGYPYPDSREGQLDLIDKFWINIRTFSTPYATYSPILEDKGFRDNPYYIEFPNTLSVQDDPIRPLKQLAISTGGAFYTNLDKGEDFISSLERIFNQLPLTQNNITKVVFAIDTTISMKQVIPFVKKEFIPKLINRLQNNTLFVGFVVYRDYEDLLKGSYLTKILGNGFTNKSEDIEKHIHSIQVGGGHDIPEAVYEAIEVAVKEFDWKDATERIIIQIGDAPPHPSPKSRKIYKDGTIHSITGPTQEEVYKMAKEKNIKIISYLLPTNVSYS